MGGGWVDDDLKFLFSITLRSKNNVYSSLYILNCTSIFSINLIGKLKIVSIEYYIIQESAKTIPLTRHNL